MKRLFSVLLCLCLCAVLLPAALAAEADVALNSTNFPDAAFRSYIASEFDSNGDGKLSQTEIDAVTEIDVERCGVSSLQGIAYFPALQNLLCGGSAITALDLTKNTNLWALQCAFGTLRTLDVSKCTKLEYLSCQGNELSALDVSKNTQLHGLDCSKNQLRALDVTKNTRLEHLSCEGNQLSTLDVSMCPDLMSAVRYGQKQTTDCVRYSWRENGNSASLSLDASTQLIFEFIPMIMTDPAAQTVKVGQTAVFTVAAEGGAPLRYQWYYRTSAKGSWYKCTTAGCTTPSLQVEGKAYRNGYQYYCRVENDLGGFLSRPAALTVLTKPVITEQPRSRGVGVGADARFGVRASGENLSYQWYFRTSASGVWTKCTTAGYNTRELTVQGKLYRSGYQYRCKVSNAVGTVYSNPATLTVTTPPVITTQPTSQTAAAGEYVQFSVAASGEGLHYQWFYAKSPGGNWNECTVDGCRTPTMRLQAKAYRDGYQYMCVVINEAGYVESDVVSLTVH